MNSEAIKTEVLINIYKNEAGIGYFKDVTIAPCPFCQGVELIVGDVDLCEGHLQKSSYQVLCARCGNGGPWGRTEEDAARIWNSGLGFQSSDTAPWVACRIHADIDDSDVPF